MPILTPLDCFCRVSSIRTLHTTLRGWRDGHYDTPRKIEDIVNKYREYKSELAAGTKRRNGKSPSKWHVK